jgi:hypothetical protein
MITLEEYIEIIGLEEAQKLSVTELELQYKLHILFADYAYKNWIKSRTLVSEQDRS